MNYISSLLSITLKSNENIINSERRKLAINLYHESEYIDSAKTWITVSDKTSEDRMSLIYAAHSSRHSLCSVFNNNEINSILSTCQLKLSEFPGYKNIRLIAHGVYKRFSPIVITDLNKQIDIISKKFEFFFWSKNNDENSSLRMLHPELVKLIAKNFLTMTADFKKEIIKIKEICDLKI